MDPLDVLVAKLNAFQPAYLASYPTMLALLAEEKRAGRLGISPLLVWSGGEHLAQRKARRLRRAFACPVINEYGASESLSIGFGCSEDWLHVNADWVVLEPVDRCYHPTRPGDTSHTVLITNLANRVQPIIRYDLGDAARVHPGRCACGNPLPAIRVEGRRDEVVVLRDNDHVARIPPIALTTVVEEVVDTLRFQIVQRTPDCLAVRLGVPTAEQRRQVFTAVASALRRYLSSLGIARVRILLDDDPPLPDARTGKLREVIVERPGAHSATTAADIQPPAVAKRTASQPNAGCS
jgi:phenylacetate-coenzyme A ligase PaaK-like adenylate-forming protein